MAYLLLEYPGYKENHRASGIVIGDGDGRVMDHERLMANDAGNVITRLQLSGCRLMMGIAELEPEGGRYAIPAVESRTRGLNSHGRGSSHQ